MDDILKDYIHKMATEKESLVAKISVEFNLKPSDIILVERQTETGRIFYPDLKSKYYLKEEEKK